MVKAFHSMLKKVMESSDPFPTPPLITQKPRRLLNIHSIFRYKILSHDLPRKATVTFQRCDAGNTVGNDQKVLKGNNKGYPAGLSPMFS